MPKKKTSEFEVPVRYTFAGKYRITARDAREAKEFVEKHCGLVLGGNIRSTLPDEDVDWDFAVHPEEEVDDPVTQDGKLLCPGCGKVLKSQIDKAQGYHAGCEPF